MKEYLFSRNLLKEAVIEVREGEKVYPLPHLGGHSPTGMEFGFGGSGPADTAVSVLADFMGHQVDDRICQTFKFHLIASIPQETGGVITGKQIEDWVKTHAPQILMKDGTMYLYNCPDCNFQLNKDMWCSLCGNQFDEFTAKRIVLKL